MDRKRCFSPNTLPNFPTPSERRRTKPKMHVPIGGPRNRCISVQINHRGMDCYQIRKRGVLIYAYANNHCAGHAPATIEQFRVCGAGGGLPKLDEPRPSAKNYLPSATSGEFLRPGAGHASCRCEVVFQLRNFGKKEGSRCRCSWTERWEGDRKARFGIL